MSRIFSIVLAVFAISLSLVGCAKNPEPPTNFIKAGELTQEQKDILELTDTQPPRLYEFDVQGAKSMKLEILTLENGEWVCHASSLVAAPDNSESYKGQIALMLTDPQDPFGGYSIAITDANGFSRSTHQPDSDGKTYKDHSTSSIADNSYVGLNQTVGVLVSYGSEETQLYSKTYFPDEALSHPEEIDSDTARLLTVTFYDKPVSEVDKAEQSQK